VTLTYKKYCILGGAGSFAIQTAKHLLEDEDATVLGVGRNPIRARPWAFTLGIEDHPRFKYRAHHVTHELDELLETLDQEQPEAIINFAAQGEGAVSWKHSWRFFETNSVTLPRLVEALSSRPWLKRFIQIGTSEMYGSVAAPAKENAPIKPTSPYAVSKVAFDMYLQSSRKVVPWNIIRPSNCYCPGQLLHRVIPRAIVAGLIGDRIPLHGGGRAKKSYLHAMDLARAIKLVANDAPLYQIFNVGPDEPTSIREVVERCADAVGLDFEFLCEESPGRPGEDSQYWLDSSSIKLLGWKQEIGWNKGLAEMVEWGEKYLPVLRGWPTDYKLRA
jgi:dTDP-glucose 4,6-dehydratase